MKQKETGMSALLANQFYMSTKQMQKVKRNLKKPLDEGERGH